MAKVFITTVTDLDDIQNHVDDMRERVDDVRPVFREMREELQDQWKRNFLTNGSLVGGWAPLDKEYGSWKSVHFPGAPPMIRTGELFRSLTDLRGKPNEINKTSARFGTNVEYFKFHQYGTSKMPERRLIFEPMQFESTWTAKMIDYIVDGDDDGVGPS